MGNIQCCGLSIQQIKNEIQAHQQALLALSNVTHSGTGHGTGILIHRALVLTSHEAFPTHTSAGEISMQDDRAATPRTVLTRRLLPSRQFITNAGLGVTVVACDPVSADHVVPLGLGLAQVTKGMDRGHRIFLLGHLKEGSRKGLITLGEGKITKEDEIIIKFSTAGDLWAPGSAGFDERGEFAFMVCNPKEPPDIKQPPKEETGQSGILVQAIRRWLKQNWQDNFDELVKPGGTDIPSSEPLPEFYTAQTVPTKKQPWLASYEKIPTELELSKTSDSGQSDAPSKESTEKAGGPAAATLGSAEWLERLASPREEQCTKIEREKKCREIYQQPSESPKSVSPGSAHSGEEKGVDLRRLTIPLPQIVKDMSVESKHSKQSSPRSPGTNSRANVDTSRRSMSPQSKVGKLPGIVTPVNKSPKIGTPEGSKEEQVQGAVTPPKCQQIKSSASESPPQTSRSPSPPRQEEKEVAAKPETYEERHVREEEVVKRQKGSPATARPRGRKRTKTIRARHVRRENGDRPKSARILTGPLESRNSSPITNNSQKQSQSGCFSGGCLSPAQSENGVMGHGVSTSEKKRPGGFSFCGSSAGSTRESSPLRKYPKSSPDTKDTASTSSKPSALDAGIKNAKYTLSNSGGSRKERSPRRSASPISSDEPGPPDRRKRTSEEKDWARHVHGVEMAKSKIKIVKARKDAARLNRKASGFPNEDHRTPEQSPPESPGPRLPHQGMPNCSRQKREERAWDMDHVEENFDVYLPPKLTAKAAKKVTDRLNRSAKRCTKNEREQRQWREDHMNTFRPVVADGPFWDRLSRQETSCSRSRRQEKGISSCWSSDSEMDETKAKDGSMLKSCFGGPSRKCSPRAKTSRTSINRLATREPRCRKSKKEDDRWARSHRRRKRKRPTSSAYGEPSKKTVSSNLPKVDTHGFKRKELHRQIVKTGPTSRDGSPRRLNSSPSGHSSRQSPAKPRCHNHAKEQEEWFQFHEDYWDDEGKGVKKKKENKSKEKIESSVKKGTTRANCVSCNKSSTSDDNKSTVSCWSTKSDQANRSRPQTPKGHITVQLPTDSQSAPSPGSESADIRPQERLEADSHPLKGKSPLKPASSSKSPQSTVGSHTSHSSSPSTRSTSAHRTVTGSTATSRSASPRPDPVDELLTRGCQGEGSSTPPSTRGGNKSDISQTLTHKGTQQPESSDKGSQNPALTGATVGVDEQSNCMSGCLYTPRSSRPATPPGPS